MKIGYAGSHIQLAEQPLLARGEPLMDRAAFGLAQHCLGLLRLRGNVAGAQIVMLVGPGNNGADALVAAAQLAKRPVAITVYLTQDPALRSATQRAALSRLSHTQVNLVELADTNDLGAVARSLATVDLLLDALLGIGASGPVRGLPGALLRSVNLELGGVSGAVAKDRKPPVRVAVDIPTGVDSATGAITDHDAAFWADHTVTFGGYKTGTLVGPGALASGALHLVDIGLPIATTQDQIHVLEYGDLAGLGIVGMPALAAHKFTAGVLGQITGSTRYPGAGVLTAGAALASGIGLLRCVGSHDLVTEIRSSHPEIVGHPGPGVTQDEPSAKAIRVNAWVWGSGVAGGSGQETRIARASENLDQLASDLDPIPLVVDAGGLTLLATKVIRPTPFMVLTPHAGELAALLTTMTGRKVTRPEVEAEPLRYARQAQRLTGTVVVLKGPVTIIAGPHATFAQRDGTARMATAGSGDVLAGLLGSLLAQHYDRIRDITSIAAAAVLIHGVAGRVAAGEVRRGNTETDHEGAESWVPTGVSRPISATLMIQSLPVILRTTAATLGKITP
ncbi:NAD(P)H-hydrate dehydratase [Jonesiaceae bacterium BS-20]|uniref:Bifunctional NAD(P)H-hydrate repair enzyme n=1 Tax=Jonesiaceae bacterium BS-20 TaxID=3120821 RepID=A0AAU7DSD5_9MICO